MSLRRIFRGIGRVWLLLMPIWLVTAGCGSYASQAEKYRVQAESFMAAAAYILERWRTGEVSGPFTRSSLQEYATELRATAQSFKSLVAPPAARHDRTRVVSVLSKAARLAYTAGQKGIEPQKAPQMARRLRELRKALIRS